MKKPALHRPALGLLGALLVSGPAMSHEFWIEPHDFSIETGAKIEADIRVGQDFKGDAFPYIPSRFRSFTFHDRSGASDVAGVTGDLPGLTLVPPGDGLAVVTYVSVAERIRFQAWEKFASYLDYEGLTAIPARHDSRGLPRDDIRELYTRCAKTLVSVGDAGAETDRATGMRLELVASEPPASLKPGAPVTFTLLWEGKPLADTQVALFRKGADGADGSRTLVRTGADGTARFTLPQTGTYMAASVHMIDAPADRNADWESYWASLTFGVE